MGKRRAQQLVVKSNYTIGKMIEMLRKQFREDDWIGESVFFDKSYDGFFKDGFFFGEESNRDCNERIIYKKNILAVIDARSIHFIVDQLSKVAFNRNFEFFVRNGLVLIKDILLKEEYICRQKAIFSDEFKVSVYSDFLFLFKLNKKTLPAKSNVYLFDDKVLIKMNKRVNGETKSFVIIAPIELRR